MNTYSSYCTNTEMHKNTKNTIQTAVILFIRRRLVFLQFQLSDVKTLMLYALHAQPLTQKSNSFDC